MLADTVAVMARVLVGQGLLWHAGLHPSAAAVRVQLGGAWVGRAPSLAAANMAIVVVGSAHGCIGMPPSCHRCRHDRVACSLRWCTPCYGHVVILSLLWACGARSPCVGRPAVVAVAMGGGTCGAAAPVAVSVMVGVVPGQLCGPAMLCRLKETNTQLRFFWFVGWVL